MIARQFNRWLPWLNQRGFLHLLSANFLTQFLGFGSSLFVAKLLDPVTLGEIKIIQSYVGLFLLLAVFGLDTATLKYCAERRVDENRESILRTAMQRSLVATAGAILLLALLALTGVIASSRHLAIWMLIYAASIPFAAAAKILMVYLQAQKRIKEMAGSQTLIKAQSFVVVIAATWFWGFRGFIFATIFAFAISLVPLLRQVGPGFLRAARQPLPASFASAAVYSLLANGVTMIAHSGDIFILDRFSNQRAAIGYYSLAITFTLAATQVTGTVQAIVTPYFSARAHDEAWVRRQIRSNQLRLAGLSVGVAAGVYVLAWILVHVVYGPAYQQLLPYLAVLLIRYVLWSSGAVIGAALVGLGLMSRNFLVAAVGTPIGLLLTYVFLDRFGVLGVAWAQAGAALITLFLMLIMQRFALRHFFASIPVAGTT